MTDGEGLSAGEFGAAFKGFLEQAVKHAPADQPYFASLLSEHFGAAAAELPIVSERFAGYEHPDLQVAVDAVLASNDRSFELLGVTTEAKRFAGISLGDLTAEARRGLSSTSPHTRGPVDYVNLDAGDDTKIACVQFGLFLVSSPEERLALLVRAGDARFGDSDVTVDVMAPGRTTAEAVLAELRTQMRRSSVYRGHVLSLEVSPRGVLEVQFHHLPAIARSEIVLPDGALERIERHTIRVSQLAERLKAAGRHLKRGLLLWGPPGTGKTLTAMYLAGQMPERTVLLLTGRTQGLIEQSCRIARLLQPATVILEDVDLVAEERTRQATGTNTVLFELLNQMDGLVDDTDVLFILTTNRPELLEEALASRPGRIDLAVEIPLPDAACRDRLIDVFSRGLTVSLRDRGALLERTEGVSAAFLRELLRQAAIISADSSDGTAIEILDGHVEEALVALLVTGGELNKRLLGATGPAGPRASC